MMLRSLFGIVLLANLLFWAWAQGWLAPAWPAPRQAEREPGRIGAQVKPEAIVVLPARAASAAVSAARALAVACMEAGPYADAEIGAAEAALGEAGLPAGSWAHEQVQPRAYWAVFAGRYPEAESRKAREEELKRLALPYELVNQPAEMAPGFVISRHASKDSAELALAAIGDKPIADVRVLAVPPAPLQHWLRVAAADAELQSKLFALDRGFKPCVERN